MVSVFQKRWLRHKTSRKTNMENSQKNSKMWNCKCYWAKMIHKHKNNSSRNWALVNNWLQEMGKIQKTGRWVPRELNDRRVNGKSAKTHVTFWWLGTKGSSFTSWKVELFWESQAQKIIYRPRRTIHINRKIESLWQKDGALCLVEAEERGLLWAVKTLGNG